MHTSCQLLMVFTAKFLFVPKFHGLSFNGRKWKQQRKNDLILNLAEILKLTGIVELPTMASLAVISLDKTKVSNLLATNR